MRIRNLEARSNQINLWSLIALQLQNIKFVRPTLLYLLTWLDAHGLNGYDPYDALSCPLIAWVDRRWHMLLLDYLREAVGAF